MNLRDNLPIKIAIIFALTLILLCVGLLPFLPKKSPEFYITLISLFLNICFLGGLLLLLKRWKK